MSNAGDPRMGLLGHPLVVALLALVGAGLALAVAAWWGASRRAA